MVSRRSNFRVLIFVSCFSWTVLNCIRTISSTNAFQAPIPSAAKYSLVNVPGKNLLEQRIGEKRIFNIQKRTVLDNNPRYRTSTSISVATTEEDAKTKEQQATLLGTLVLLTVPLSWGTYVPVVRYLYTIQPPVPGFVFSACYYTLAAGTTALLASRQLQPSTESTQSLPTTSEDMTSDKSGSGDEKFTFNSNGGVELGSYLFIANCLQVIGLQTVESDRAGFLVQLTTVMVPICEGVFAGNILLIPARTWCACVMAFLGLCIMGLDGKDETATALLATNNPWESIQGAALSISQGDLLILGAAVLYTLHVVRLGTYARRTTPMKLAASKATTESILSFALLFVLMGLSTLQDTYNLMGPISSKDGLIGFSVDTGREITSFFSSFAAGVSDGSISTSVLLPAFGSILWTGWVTCAYTIWAQSFGQSKVSPTSANLIYTFQPIFTALFAYFLLGEKMGSAGFLGGAIIASAVYIVASNDSDNSDALGTETE